MRLFRTDRHTYPTRQNEKETGERKKTTKKKKKEEKKRTVIIIRKTFDELLFGGERERERGKHCQKVSCSRL